MSDASENRQRDAIVLKILGAFFVVMGVLVLIGTIWCWGHFRATTVNIACGAILTSIGVGMFLGGQRMSRRRESD